MSMLPKRALKEVVKVSKTATVMDAVRAMAKSRVGAVVVLDEHKLLGVFTERDVVTRVVLEKRDTESTRVADVMTTSVLTVRDDADRSQALRLMIDNHIRHLPVIDKDGRVAAMLSMRHLLREDIQELRQTVWALVADSAADGAGG